MSLYSDLNEILTPCAQRIKGLGSQVDEVNESLGELTDVTDATICPLKNLFDKNNVNVINSAPSGNSSDGYTYGSNSGAKTIWIPCKPNTSYVVSKQAGTRFAVVYSANVPVIGGAISGYSSNPTASSIKITTDASAKYLAAFVWFGSTDTGITFSQMLDTVQIEEGDKATTYEPFTLTAVDLEARQENVDTNTRIDSKINAMPYQFIGNWGNSEFFTGASLTDILAFEKTSCIHHDNFHRADNASDIGYNGNDSVTMAYTSLNTVDGAQLNVGISNNKAVFTNPQSVANSAVAMRIIDINKLPYKITVASDSYASIVVGVVDSTHYVRVIIQPNIISISNSGTPSQADGASFSHSMGICNAEIYVYENAIVGCIAGKEVVRSTANILSTKCGLLFRAGEPSISFNMFNVFTLDKYENNKLDELVEKTDGTTQRIFGVMQTGNANGITRDSSVTCHSAKSLKFYLTPNDDVSNASIRSELVPIDPKPEYHNLQSKIFDFDVYFPSDYADEYVSEIFLQMHDRPDGVNVEGLHPGIELYTRSGKMYLAVRGYATKVQLSEKDNIPTTEYDLGNIAKGQWKHFTIYMREGYMAEHYPVVALWIDRELKVVCRGLNTYNELYGSYLKFGMYKPAWKTAPTTVDSRTVYFDNFIVWQ